MTFPRVPRRGSRVRGSRKERTARAVGGGNVVIESARHAASVSGIPAACSCVWRILSDGMIDPHDGRQFDLVKHGLDAVAAKQQAAHSRVVIGRYPTSREITGDAEAVNAALNGLSTSGAHFTYFASVYRSGDDGLLLLDYIG